MIEQINAKEKHSFIEKKSPNNTDNEVKIKKEKYLQQQNVKRQIPMRKYLSVCLLKFFSCVFRHHFSRIVSG